MVISPSASATNILSRVTRHSLVALIGANGMLARMVAHEAPPQWRIVPFDLPEFDLCNQALVAKVIGELKPDLIINCAAFTQVDACETQQDLANKVNGEGPGHLAAAAMQVGATLVHISTDYVFDGQKTSPYAEDDRPNPSSAYGRSKLLGEEAIARSGLQEYFIVRTSWLYGPGGKNFVETIIRLASERQELRIVADQVGSPTYTGDLARAIFNLVATETRDLSPVTRHPSPVSASYGIYHFSNAGQCSWYDFACEIVAVGCDRGLPLKAKKVVAIRTEEYPLPAQRPAYSVFDTKKYQKVTGAVPPIWQDSLRTYFDLR